MDDDRYRRKIFSASHPFLSVSVGALILKLRHNHENYTDMIMDFVMNENEGNVFVEELLSLSSCVSK